MLTARVKSSMDESVLCWLATIDEDGVPNVSPKEMFTHHGDNKVLIANIASPQSAANVASNPNVCVSFIHVFKQKGFKLVGKARLIHRSHSEYQTLEDKLYALGGREFRLASIFEVTVYAVSPIIAPSYLLFPQTTEADQIKKAKKAYNNYR
ncbi:MAG TPA: pyridoxamine 5'-phosphate oxidase family protein [Marinagarivorans sp.]